MLEKFLYEFLGDKLNLSFRNSKRGWIYDSKNLSKNIKTDLVMVWVEDHILINTYKYFEEVLREMYLKKINCLHYSFHTEDKKSFNSLQIILANLKSWKFKKNYIKNTKNITPKSILFHL